MTAYFPNVPYTRVEKNTTVERDRSIYEVRLSNGFEIDFDSAGDWVDIDGQTTEIPAGIIPSNITSY